jgi:protein phosphatase
MIYVWASGTDTGRVRGHNEDAVWPVGAGVASAPFTAAVADGMGGHVGGEIASRVALQAAIDTDGDPTQRILAANRAVVDRVRREPALAGMGTTLTLGMLDSTGRVEIGHVGDSRAYLLRDEELTQLTQDHSLVAEMVEQGRLDPGDAASHPYRSVITRAIGLEEDLEVDRHDRVLRSGDRFLLCTDGLSGMVADGEIAELLGLGSPPEDVVAALVEAANAAGGVDNVTVVVVDVADDEND